MVMQHMMASVKLHEAPHMSEINENHPKRGSFRLLDVFGLFFGLIYM